MPWSSYCSSKANNIIVVTRIKSVSRKKMIRSIQFHSKQCPSIRKQMYSSVHRNMDSLFETLAGYFLLHFLIEGKNNGSLACQ
jgi:hypothetical protein